MMTLSHCPRRIFIDFVAATLAKHHWLDVADHTISSDSDFNNKNWGSLRGFFPEYPSIEYGDQVYVSVSRTAVRYVKNATSRRSVIAELETAKRIAKFSNISTMRAWHSIVRDEFSKHNFPLPSSPNKHYEEWVGWPEFLGEVRRPEFLSFDEASALVQSLGIRDIKHFKEYIASGFADPRMPARPDSAYSDHWTGWPGFLAPRFVDYETAKSLLEGFRLNSEADFRKLGLEGMRPQGIPSHPAVYYKDWAGWPDFLGKRKRKQTKTAS